MKPLKDSPSREITDQLQAPSSQSGSPKKLEQLRRAHGFQPEQGNKEKAIMSAEAQMQQNPAKKEKRGDDHLADISTDDVKNEKRSENIEAASTTTSTEQMASKHTQGSRWRNLLKIAVITLLAATGSAQEAYVNTASMRDNHGPEGSLEQRFMLRGSRNWPGLVQEKKKSEKHSGSLSEENMNTHYEQENHGRQLLGIFGSKKGWKNVGRNFRRRSTRPSLLFRIGRRRR